MTDLLLLAERVEGAEGPDRRFDALVFIALNPDEQKIIGHKPGRFPQIAICVPLSEFVPFAEVNGGDCADYIGAPAYTASLDASLTLVPEGWSFEIKWNYCHLVTEDGVRVATEGWAATPALALTAACLRARSTMEGLS